MLFEEDSPFEMRRQTPHAPQGKGMKARHQDRLAQRKISENLRDFRLQPSVARGVPVGQGLDLEIEKASIACQVEEVFERRDESTLEKRDLL